VEVAAPPNRLEILLNGRTYRAPLPATMSGAYVRAWK
jgi:hypothetical protein